MVLYFRGRRKEYNIFSRTPRNFLKTPLFHVMTQGIEKSYIFNYDREIQYYINTLQELQKDSNVKTIAYCIMHNHAHMILNSEENSELSKFMQRLNTKYAMYYNKKYDRVGYVFRNRFKSQGIYSEKQFYNCINYIYNNPVKAGICQKIEDYKYSNFKENQKYLIENFECDEYFIDIEEHNRSNEDDKDIVEQYIKKHKIITDDLIKNKSVLKMMVNYLTSEKGMSFRRIEKEIGISRETLRMLKISK